MAEVIVEGEEQASEIRRGVGEPTSESRRRRPEAHDARRDEGPELAQLRAVGTAFLRARPFIVAPVALGQGAILATADVPSAQRLALGVAIAAMLALFTVEAVLVRRRLVNPRWLFGSLALTAAGIALGILLSGGVSSPLLVLIMAPLVVAFAAFGRRPRAAWLLVGVLLAVVGVGLCEVAGVLPWTGLPEPAVGAMRLVAFAGAVALAWTGVARLAGAYAEAARQLAGLRLEAVAAATTRLREVEQMSAKVAHELKNPLAAVKALLQLEAQRETSERGARRLGVALGEIDRMEGLVRDYLAFARPLAELRREPVAVGELVADVATLLVAQATRRDVGVVVQASSGGGPSAYPADRARLREALFNLLANAVEASPAGTSVTVELAVVGPDLRITISDRGPGIPARIASALAIGESAFLTTRPEGTGLGLAIARAAILQHGGRLAFLARDGGGTVACIELPLEVP